VQLLIGAFPDSLRHVDNVGYTPLHDLCENKKLDEDIALEVLKLLTEKTPESVRQTSTKGSLPIHLAAETRSPEFCRILIEAYPESERMANRGGSLPFDRACRYNTVATVKYFYQLYPESISMADNNGMYPIHRVIWGLKYRKGDPKLAIEVVRFLLDCNTYVALQKFPLYWVCKRATNDNTLMLNAYLEILQLLYGEDPDAIDMIASRVGTFCPEVQTFINTQLEYARQARDHTFLTTPNESGQLPLHRALRDTVTLGSIKLLVKGNPFAIRCTDNTGMIPLHVACQHHDSPSVVEYLVGLNPMTLDVNDLWQNTVLHFACRNANYTMIRLLLEKYSAASVSKRNFYGQLPVDLLFESEAVNDREDVEYTESIYRLIRAHPETLME
jgi:ankyrin repeat protein